MYGKVKGTRYIQPGWNELKKKMEISGADSLIFLLIKNHPEYLVQVQGTGRLPLAGMIKICTWSGGISLV